MSKTLLFAGILAIAIPLAVTAEAISEPADSAVSPSSITTTILMPGAVLLIGTALAGSGVALRRKNRSAARPSRS